MQVVRLGAALVMGLAISGMHYTGMAASRFSPDSWCIGAPGANGNWLAITIAVLALAVLTITTILLIYDAHLEIAHTAARPTARSRPTLSCSMWPITTLLRDCQTGCYSPTA